MNQFKKYIFSMCVALGAASQLHATTLVYSMRIHRAFTQTAFLQNLNIDLNKKVRLLSSLVPIIQNRKRHFVKPLTGVNVYDKRLIGGAIINGRVTIGKRWWIELTTALLSESAKDSGTVNFKASRTGLDDIVLAVGHHWYPSEKGQWIVYAMGGFPSKWDVTLQETFGTLVGTRFFSVGAGAEYSYSFFANPHHSFIGIAQFRFLHFFNRRWYPILPCDAEIQPGDTTDFLASLRYRQDLNTYEVGYNPTIFTNQAVLLPVGKDATGTFLSNGAYFNFSRLCKEVKLFKKPTILGGGCSMSRSKQFEARTYAAWLSLSVVF